MQNIFQQKDQNRSLQYLFFIAWSFTRIVLILVSYKQPSQPKGLASILITWSSADKSNSSKGLISAKALLPMCWRLFGKTNWLDWRSSHFLNASFPISSKPSSKLRPMISLLERNVLRELPQKAWSPIFLIVEGIVNLHSLKCQSVKLGWKASYAISEITCSVPSHSIFPPLKLKLPVTTKLLDTPVIFVCLGSK